MNGKIVVGADGSEASKRRCAGRWNMGGRPEPSSKL